MRQIGSLIESGRLPPASPPDEWHNPFEQSSDEGAWLAATLVAPISERRQTIIVALTGMFLACAEHKLPDSQGLEILAAAWEPILDGIPTAEVIPAFEQAVRDQATDAARCPWPVNAAQVRAAWLHAQKDAAYTVRMPEVKRLAAPTPTPATVAGATTRMALLAATAREMGDPVVLVALLRADRALAQRDPQATVEQWRRRLAVARRADTAPTLKSLVDSLLFTAEATP